MSQQPVTAGERRCLLALMAVATEVSTYELHLRTGVSLEKPERKRLSDLGLVTSQLVGGSYVHELTGDGWSWCREHLATPEPAAGGAEDRLVDAMLAGVDQFLVRSGLQLTDVFQPAPEPAVDRRSDGEIDVDQLVRKAYGDLAAAPGSAVRLARLRRHLEDVVRADLDASLHRLHDAPDVSVDPDPDPDALSPEDRAAALRIDGEDRHLLVIDGS